MLKLVLLVFVIAGVLLFVGAYAMLHTTYKEFKEVAQNQILQIEEILVENDDNAQQLQEELKEDFLIRAKAAAYMIQYNQEVIYDIEQLEYIATLLQIDEINLFTPDGKIYSGNEPRYYGYTFDSGEQMSFFKPLLEDYDLELVQDVTPNTADNKAMQYVAVWSEDRQHIVQIGIEPLRLLEAMEATELSFVFSRLTPTVNTLFFAVDIATGEVISSTSPTLNGYNLSELGLSDFYTEDLGLTKNAVINGESGHTLLVQQSDNIYIGYFQSNTSIYGPTLVSIAYLIVISLLVATLIIVLIYFLLDRVVLRGFMELGKGMERIANGDLEYQMEVAGLPEFKSLSSNVNFMVKQVVESSRKFSTIFEQVNVPIAMYECKSDVVIATGKLVEILQIHKAQQESLLKSSSEFLHFIEDIMSSPHADESDVYSVSNENGERFLKILRYKEGESDWGLIIDSTNEINEKYMMKQERDFDYLTKIYGKRAFYEHMERLSNRPKEVKKAAVLMIDLDNLKYVNDTWGHTTGDSFICAMANVLDRFDYEHKLCARLSGDEFAMILYGNDDYHELEACLEKIREQLEQTYIKTPSGMDYKVGASVGCSFYPEQAQSFQACLDLADKAMYTEKSKKKNTN